MAKVCVIGTGTMGQGIAQLAAARGFDVRVVDVDARQGPSRDRRSARAAQKGKLADRPHRDARALDRRDGRRRRSERIDVVIGPARGHGAQVDLFRGSSPPRRRTRCSAEHVVAQPHGLGARSAPERTIGLHFFNRRR